MATLNHPFETRKGSVGKAISGVEIRIAADGEVLLDIEVIGSVAPGAKIVVYFAPNTSQGFQDAISAAILATLRPMMRAVVTSGTAAGVGFPPGVYGKTGTAQYGNGPNPPSHGWFIGYRGDLAFAVLVEGGGLGADSAGPIANAFLRKL